MKAAPPRRFRFSATAAGAHSSGKPLALELQCPPQMAGAIRDVLDGEYESGYSAQQGDALTVLDIGANVGAFALWATLRWPGCAVHCYEPHPLTFAMLRRNVADVPAIACSNAAVYPQQEPRAPLWARYAGDGEAALVVEAARTFRELRPGEIDDVAVVRPCDLPACDVVKLDVEGAEAAILGDMDLDRVSLVLLEYQNAANRAVIEKLLGEEFFLVYEDRFPWSALLPESRYRPELAGDSYGHLFLVNRIHNRLRREEGIAAGRRAAPPGRPPALSPARSGLGRLLRFLRLRS